MQTILEFPPFDSEIPLPLLSAKQCTMEDRVLHLLGCHLPCFTLAPSFSFCDTVQSPKWESAREALPLQAAPLRTDFCLTRG